MEFDFINKFTVVVFKVVDFSVIQSHTPSLEFVATLLL